MNSIKDRFKKKYNIALAELDYQDKWQRTKIGIVTLNNQKKVIESLFQRIMAEVEENIDGEIIDYGLSYF